MATGSDVSTDSSVAGVASKSVFLASEDSFEVERDRLLDDLIRYKMENEQLK